MSSKNIKIIGGTVAGAAAFASVSGEVNADQVVEQDNSAQQFTQKGISKTNQSVDQAKKTVEDTTQEVKKDQSDLDSKNKDQSNIDQDIQKSADNNDKAKQDITKDQEALNKAKDETKNQQQVTDETQKETNAAKDQVTDQQKKVNNDQETVDKAQKEQETADKAHNDAKDALDHQKELVNNDKTKVNEATQAKDTAEKQQKVAKEDAAKKATEQEAAQKEADRIANEAKAAQAKAIADAKKKAADDKAKSDLANSQREKAQQEAKEAQAQRDQAQKEAQTAKNKAEASKKQAEKTANEAATAKNNAAKTPKQIPTKPVAIPAESDGDYNDQLNTIDSELQLPDHLVKPKYSEETENSMFFRGWYLNGNHNNSEKINGALTDKQQQEINNYALTLINNYRKQNGLAPITMIKESQAAAMQEMQERMELIAAGKQDASDHYTSDTYFKEHRGIDKLNPAQNLGWTSVDNILDAKIGILNFLTGMIWQDGAHSHGHRNNILITPWSDDYELYYGGYLATDGSYLSDFYILPTHMEGYADKFKGMDVTPINQEYKNENTGWQVNPAYKKAQDEANSTQNKANADQKQAENDAATSAKKTETLTTTQKTFEQKSNSLNVANVNAKNAITQSNSSNVKAANAEKEAQKVYNETVAASANKLTAANSALKKSQAHAENANQNVIATTAALKVAQEKLEHDQDTAQLEADITSTASQLDQANNRLATTKVELKNSQNELATLMRTYKDKQAVSDAASASLKKLQAKEAQLEQQVKKDEQAVEKTQAKLDQLKQYKEELPAQIKQAEEKLQQAKQRLADAQINLTVAKEQERIAAEKEQQAKDAKAKANLQKRIKKEQNWIKSLPNEVIGDMDKAVAIAALDRATTQKDVNDYVTQFKNIYKIDDVDVAKSHKHENTRNMNPVDEGVTVQSHSSIDTYDTQNQSSVNKSRQINNGYASGTENSQFNYADNKDDLNAELPNTDSNQLSFLSIVGTLLGLIGFLGFKLRKEN